MLLWVVTMLCYVDLKLLGNSCYGKNLLESPTLIMLILNGWLASFLSKNKMLVLFLCWFDKQHVISMGDLHFFHERVFDYLLRGTYMTYKEKGYIVNFVVHGWHDSYKIFITMMIYNSFWWMGLVSSMPHTCLNSTFNFSYSNTKYRENERRYSTTNKIWFDDWILWSLNH